MTTKLHPDVKRRLEQMPSSMHKTYLQAVERKSRTAAVKAMCQQCGGYDRNTVRDCTSYACPLYPYRPYQKKTKGDEDTSDE